MPTEEVWRQILDEEREYQLREMRYTHEQAQERLREQAVREAYERHYARTTEWVIDDTLYNPYTETEIYYKPFDFSTIKRRTKLGNEFN